MPTFPSYDGPPLPKVLNPLNPRHYWMLADWIFLKPSRLKQYLSQAEPTLYLRPHWDVRSWAYLRRAFLGLAITAIFLSFLASGLHVAFLRLLGVSVSWGAWLAGIALGMAAGVVRGSVIGEYGFGLTAALITIWCTILGIGCSVVTNLIYHSILFPGRPGFSIIEASIIVAGATIGTALNVENGLRWRSTWTTLWRTTLFGITFVAVISVGYLGFSTGVRETRSVMEVPAHIPEIPQVLGLLQLLAVLLCVGMIMGLTRMPFAIVQAILSANGEVEKNHPVLWDELLIVPLCGTVGFINRSLRATPTSGLRILRRLLRNRSQYWLAGRVVQRYIASIPNPLDFFYTSLSHSWMDEYPVEPVEQNTVASGLACGFFG